MKLAEAGLAIKVPLAPSATPEDINAAVKAAFPDVFQSYDLARYETKHGTGWCLLLREEKSRSVSGVPVKILRPTSQKQGVTMDDIVM